LQSLLDKTPGASETSKEDFEQTEKSNKDGYSEVVTNKHH